METKREEPIRVIIADDHILYRAGLKATFSFKKRIQILEEVNNGVNLLNLLKTTHADVILLDIQMPVMDGMVVLPVIKNLYPNVKVIVLTMMEDQSVITKLMELGANSYLAKTTDAEFIYEAIETCYEKEFYFNSLTNKSLHKYSGNRSVN